MGSDSSHQHLMMANSILPPAQGQDDQAHLFSSTGQDDQASDAQDLHDGVVVAQAFCHSPKRVFLRNPPHLLHLEELRE